MDCTPEMRQMQEAIFDEFERLEIKKKYTGLPLLEQLISP